MRLLGVSLLVGLAAVGQARGQVVTLQIHPRLGDTIHMRLDQQTEMTGMRRDAKSEATAVLTNMTMFSRAIVEGRGTSAMLVLAVTDSVSVTSDDEEMRKQAIRVEKQLRGQRARFHVSHDGTVTVADDDTKAMKEVSEVVSLMPATFPKAAVSVGESWMREMPLASGSFLGGAPISGKLHMTFRLDSLGRGGDIAFVSMRGEMQPATALPGTPMIEKGSVTGTMLVDRQRGWLTDSRFNVMVTSVLSAPVMTGVAPMRMRVRITQHMQTVDKK